MSERRRQLLPARHTGRRAPHSHTSYAGLTFLLILVGLVLLTFTFGALADERVDVRATVNGPVPTTPPTITQPTDGQRFQNAEINTTGTCTRGYLVKLYKNNILAGSTTCSYDQQWTLPISLLPGRNDLVAQQFNYSEQEGPASATVTVYLDPPPASPPSKPGAPRQTTSAPAQQSLVLTPQKLFQGALVNEQMVWIYTVAGGQGPFNFELDWGDGDKDVFAGSDRAITQKHTYLNSGEYKVVLRVRDAADQQAIVQTIALVRDLSPAQTIDTRPPSSRLAIAWPLFGLALLLLLSFWLGEKHELEWLRRHPARERQILHRKS